MEGIEFTQILDKYHKEFSFLLDSTQGFILLKLSAKFWSNSQRKSMWNIFLCQGLTNPVMGQDLHFRWGVSPVKTWVKNAFSLVN